MRGVCVRFLLNKQPRDNTNVYKGLVARLAARVVAHLLYGRWGLDAEAGDG